MTETNEVIASLEFLSEDEDVPKSVLNKIEEIVNELKNNDQLSLAVNKSTTILEELSEDVNIPPFVKTQIWGILSQLAALEAQIVEN